MNASIPTDDDLRDLMARVVATTPPAPSFDRALALAAQRGVVAGPEFHVASDRRASRPHRRRSITTLIAAILVALGLTAGGYFAYATFIGPDGYDTPTEAVEAFVDAASGGDLLRASRALAPFERDHMAERLEAVLALVTEKGLLADNDLAAARNIRLEPSGLRWSEHPMTPDFTRVEADAGTLELSFDGRLFGVAVDGGPGPQRVDLVRELRPGGADGSGSHRAGFVTTYVDGAWYVSLSHSVFETIRLASDAPLPDLTQPADARGAATPEAAATAALLGFYDTTGASPDPGLLPLIDPIAGEAFQMYLPVLVENDGGNDDALGEPQMRSPEWSISGDGEFRVADLTSFETPDYDLTTGAQTGTYRRVEVDDCDSADWSGPCQAWTTSVALVERSGRWYVDPIESLGRMIPTTLFGRVSASELSESSAGSSSSGD